MTKRDCWLPQTRVTQSELAAHKAKASEAGLTLSALVRASLENVVIPAPAPILPSADVALIAQLSAIGGNVNQLARSANIHGWLDPQQVAELDELTHTIRTMIRRIMDGS